VTLAWSQAISRLLAMATRLRATNAIPIAQKFEQHRRKYGVAILATFALLDAQHHAFGVDIGYLQ
jgi:hypothetical protein